MSYYDDEIAPNMHLLDEGQSMAKTTKLKSRTRRRKSAKKGAKNKGTRRTKKAASKSEGGFLGKPPISLILYGPSGVGKTSLASHFPGVGFIYDDQELGVERLADYEKIKRPKLMQSVSSFEELLDVSEGVAANEHPEVETIVFDTLTGIEKLCFAFHCREYFDDNWTAKGFFSYMQGPKNAAKTDIPRFIDVLRDINESGRNVIILGHSQVKPYNNPSGPDYDRFTPVCDKETWQQFHRWAGAVLFYNYESIKVEEEGVKGKASQEVVRFIYTEWSPGFDAKNQYGLPGVLEAGEDSESAYEAIVEGFA